MDSKTSYEILIAEKARQLPVPDMADAIWASIEQQLDAGNTPDAEDAPVSQKLPGKGFSGIGKLWLIIVAAVVLIAIIVIWKKAGNKKNAIKKTGEPVMEKGQKVQEKRPDSSAINYPAGERQTQSLPARNDKKIPVNAGIDSALFVKDSIIPQPVAAPAKDPLVINSKDVQVPDSVGAKQPPPKKSRGVKGISESDYKIISIKKDSAKKGE